jgi:dihydrodiol dehydrogenase / D-xylose 1-dehydrogenase (NADP)
MAQPLKWGFFGAGRITSDFVSAISILPKANHLAVAIAARDLSRAQEFAAETKLSKAFGDYKTLAADPEIGTSHSIRF